MYRGGFHKELRLVLSQVNRPNLELALIFLTSPRTSSHFGLVLTLCEIDPLMLYFKGPRLSASFQCDILRFGHKTAKFLTKFFDSKSASFKKI